VSVGAADGLFVVGGCVVGSSVGRRVGEGVGTLDGLAVGSTVGAYVGERVGSVFLHASYMREIIVCCEEYRAANVQDDTIRDSALKHGSVHCVIKPSANDAIKLLQGVSAVSAAGYAVHAIATGFTGLLVAFNFLLIVKGFTGLLPPTFLLLVTGFLALLTVVQTDFTMVETALFSAAKPDEIAIALPEAGELTHD
jgi:hypothetical protein